MGPASVTVTKTNLNLAPGGTEMLEAKVNYDDGSSDYNYRVAFSAEGVASVRHSGSQLWVTSGQTGGEVSLKVISNKNPAIAAAVKIFVAGVAPSLKVREGGGEFSNVAYIDQLYQEILHRPADRAGRSYWTKMLDKGLYTKEEVREAFLQSAG